MRGHMNRRLARILSYIPDGLGVIDVGTDHGILPAALALRGYPGQIFASDIRPGPLEAARRTAETAGVTEKICFLLCDGLDLCPPDGVDTLVIAGMGGDTICGILDRAEWCMDRRYKLVLQPMTRAEVLRYWLVYNEFAIEQEDLAEDGREVYQLFTARFGGSTRLSDGELFTGSYQMIKDHPLFPAFLSGQIGRFEKAAAGLRAGGVRHDTAGKLQILEQVLAELKEMARHDEG